MPNSFQIKTRADYEAAYKKSIENPESFWNDIANTFLWRKPWAKTLEWNFTEPDIKWFSGGKLYRPAFGKNGRQTCNNLGTQQPGRKGEGSYLQPVAQKGLPVCAGITQ